MKKQESNRKAIGKQQRKPDPTYVSYAQDRKNDLKSFTKK